MYKGMQAVDYIAHSAKALAVASSLLLNSCATPTPAYTGPPQNRVLLDPSRVSVDVRSPLTIDNTLNNAFMLHLYDGPGKKTELVDIKKALASESGTPLTNTHQLTEILRQMILANDPLREEILHAYSQDITKTGPYTLVVPKSTNAGWLAESSSVDRNMALLPVKEKIDDGEYSGSTNRMVFPYGRGDLISLAVSRDGKMAIPHKDILPKEKTEIALTDLLDVDSIGRHFNTTLRGAYTIALGSGKDHKGAGYTCSVDFALFVDGGSEKAAVTNIENAGKFAKAASISPTCLDEKVFITYDPEKGNHEVRAVNNGTSRGEVREVMENGNFIGFYPVDDTGIYHLRTQIIMKPGLEKLPKAYRVTFGNLSSAISESGGAGAAAGAGGADGGAQAGPSGGGGPGGSSSGGSGK